MIGKKRFLLCLLGVSIQTQGTTLNCSVKNGHVLAEHSMGDEWYQKMLGAEYVFRILDEDEEILQNVRYKDGTKGWETKYQMIYENEFFKTIWGTKNQTFAFESLVIGKENKTATISTQDDKSVTSWLLDCEG